MILSLKTIVVFILLIISVLYLANIGVKFFSKVQDKTSDAILIKGMDFYINSSKIKKKVPTEIRPIIKLTANEPILRIFEDNRVAIKYKIEPLKENPHLKGQFLHASLRILENFAVMLDGIIVSNSLSKGSSLKNSNTEGIRFQPFFLSISNVKNKELIGRGLFDRGLHFSGHITPYTIRICCVCDHCKEPFNIQSFHAGFSQLQYFYSGDSSRTLVVDEGEIDKMPGQLQEKVDKKVLNDVEAQLPLPDNNSGEFKYYNPFRCPHCKAPYIDFARYPELRSYEYYGNTYIGEETQRYKKGKT